MSVLLYAGETTGRVKELLGLIEKEIPEEEIELHTSIEDLTQRLRRPKRNLAIIILVAVTAKELENLLLIRDFFDDLPIILVLPDKARKSLLRGQKLFPRFVTDMEGDLSEVALVLKHLLERARL